MITLIEPCDKMESNKSNKRQHQKPEKEDLQFFDEELLYGNDNSLNFWTPKRGNKQKKAQQLNSFYIIIKYIIYFY